MRSTLLSWNKEVCVLVALLVLKATVVSAEDFQFFGGAIDFWNEGASQQAPDKRSSDASLPRKDVTEAVPSPKAGSFPWQQYLDPKNKEFFREGDYTPPEPFMEIVRNPSDANLKLWFDYISKKNELSTRLEERMREYLAKSGAAIPKEAGEKLVRITKPGITTAPDSKRYRFRLYFDSNCPHCKHMFATMTELQERGYFVDARQVDRGTQGLSGIPIPSEPASPAELQSKQIQSVPVLLVGDLAKKVVYRINGYQTVAQVLGALPKEEKEQ